MPAVNAASLPKLRDSRTYRTPGCTSQGAMAAGVASRLPSSMTMTSQRSVNAASCAVSPVSRGPRLAASLKAGTTQLMAGRLGRVAGEWRAVSVMGAGLRH